jgi:hypothetical protein
MDPVRFDRLTKSRSSTDIRRALLRLQAAVPVTGGVLPLFEKAGVAEKRSRGGKGKDGKHGKDHRPTQDTHPSHKDKGKPQKTLSFCQNGQTITAPRSQQEALLAAGATLGACPDPGDPCAKTGEACTSSANCCGAEVYGAGKTNAQACRSNHVPVALDVTVSNPWQCAVPGGCMGYDPDFDLARVRILSLPQSDFLTEFVGGDPVDLSNVSGTIFSGKGWATGLPHRH